MAFSQMQNWDLIILGADLEIHKFRKIELIVVLCNNKRKTIRCRDYKDNNRILILKIKKEKIHLNHIMVIPAQIRLPKLNQRKRKLRHHKSSLSKKLCRQVLLKENHLNSLQKWI